MAGNEMGFNLQNCNLVHLGKNNPEHKYYMTRRYLQSSKIKQNIKTNSWGKIASRKLDINLQCDMAVKPAKTILDDLQSTACHRRGI